MDIRGQIKNNLLAIISLVVAFSALGYNTWRNELTEHNRKADIAVVLGELVTPGVIAQRRKRHDQADYCQKIVLDLSPDIHRHSPSVN